MKKLLAVGVIVLFLGMSVIPSTGTTDVRQITVSTSNGNTLYVGGSGPGNYSKIQDAIDNASNGDTVYVYDDSSPYYEDVVVDKSINLIGEDKDTTRICGGDDSCYAVNISADWVNISGFTLENYDLEWGILLLDSNKNNISGNIIPYNRRGIDLSNTSNNTIMDNTIIPCNEGFVGIRLSKSSNNTIMDNTITPCYPWEGDGIYLSKSNCNTISNNNISDNTYGLSLSNSNNNTINENIYSNNWNSINLVSSSNNNIISNNNFLENQHDIIVENYSIYNIIINNTFSNVKCCSCICIRNSNMNIIMNNTINSVPGGWGILIQFSKENTVLGNTIINLKWQCGIYLWGSSNNTISCNNLICCNKGIVTGDNDNIIHHNNFINNEENAYDEYNNTWDDDYPSGGNFWDDYTGNDSNGDGIGDTPYPIPGGDNEDRYPLMEPYGNDTLPPITTISLDPPSPNGDNGWYVSNVTVALKSTDDGIGVKAIYYRVTGGQWINQTGDVLTFLLDYDCLEDGLIEFYSVDYFGNQEEIKSVSIDMDQLPPDIEEVTWESFQDPPIYGLWYVTFIVNATDACSSMDRVEMFVNDWVHEIIVGAGPTYMFTTEWWAVFMRVTFRFYCYDEAGNVASVLVNDSDIDSYSYSQSYRTLFLRWLDRFPLLQCLLDILGWYKF